MAPFLGSKVEASLGEGTSMVLPRLEAREIDPVRWRQMAWQAGSADSRPTFKYNQ